MYRAVYFHHTVRAASCLLSSVLRRAFELQKAGKTTIPSKDSSGREHPLRSLFSQGEGIDLGQYVRLGEYQLWSLIEAWQESKDRILADLAKRLMCRRLFKTIEVDPTNIRQLEELKERAEKLTVKALDHVGEKTVHYYVSVDEPSRTSYKRYDWRSEASDESIWIIGTLGKPMPIEDESRSIVDALKKTIYRHRLVIPHEIRADLIRPIK
jgi:HD superfamily phosphohydrolase